MTGGLYSAGAQAADELLRDVYRQDVAKALDPLDARDFLSGAPSRSSTSTGRGCRPRLATKSSALPGRH